MSEVTSESVLICGGPRRRGRPRVIAGESSVISVRVWSEHHDALLQKAQAQRMPLSDYVRSVLAAAAEFRTQK